MKNSIKNGRKKREISGEALESVYQNGPLDYEELLQSLSEEYPHMMQNQEKRFLGEFCRYNKQRKLIKQAICSGDLE